MTATDRATEVLKRCEAERAYRVKAETADPTAAKRDRTRAADNGWASEYDDPNLTVRASILEQLCADAIALHDLRTLLAGLPDDGWQPADWDALSEAQHNARTALENR